uniref:Integrase, catalytic region, zinc finger, CCHC-type, peptidase aspartic, catalytic n=1 Tax=Tanacetum cinerariifolium TaxID=118510 RepID=A0A6L2MQ45_TANCI|nr:integrase, catalytic region, zinc finger, CCHC-type, peptidase aspartic, catalytic [Tanacetum cinerariifolium]
MLLEGSESTKEDWESQLYDDFEHFRQNKGETIHNYYVRFAKLINDMRNIKMIMPRMQLNSNLLITCCLNRDLQNRGQGNNARGTSAAGNKGAQNRVGDVNLGQASQIKCYNCNGISQISRNCTQPKRPENSEYFKDKMLLIQAQENGVVLDEEQLLFITGGQDNVIDEDVDEPSVQDLTLNVDNVFHADECDAFDCDVDEAPTAQTLIMANLSSAYPVYGDADLSYDSDILSEVHDHDNYQDAVCELHEVHEMHNNVQPNCVVDSDAEYPSDSNIIMYDQYVKDNAKPVVQNNVSFIQHDEFMMIINEMHEQTTQCVSVKAHTKVFDASLTAELAIYREQVELYERRAKFELIEREQKIEEQLRIVITDCNIKEENLKKEPHSVKMQLNSTINHNKSMVKEVTSLKKNFQQKENKYLEEFLDMKALKEKVKDKLFKQDQSFQIVHMLCKPKSYYDERRKAFTQEIKEIKEIFEELKVEVDQNVVNRKCDETERKNLLIENDNLIADFLSKEVFFIATNSELTETCSEADRTLSFRALDFQITYLTEKVTVLQEQNELFRVENAKMKQDYKELNNREVHLDYLKHLPKSVATLREIVEKAKVEGPLDRSLASACLHTKHSQELLEYVIGTCPKDFNKQHKKHASTPLTRKKQVTFEEQCATSNNNIHKHVEKLNIQKTNVLVLPSTGINSCTDASRSRPRSNTKKNTISPAKRVNKKKVEAHPRTNKSSLKTTNHVIQIVLWYLDSGCSKPMTGHHSRLRNFMKKFIGTVRFGNGHFGAIMGYEDYVIGDSVISKVYYVEGLGHNLFSVGQFFDSDLEVAFGKHSCYVRDTYGIGLIKGSHSSNLYTILVEDMLKSSPIYLLSKASKNKSWLSHRRLNHLNFDTINDLARKDLVRGLPRLKFEKDHLYSAFLRAPQQNDVVERRNRTLMEAGRTMLIFSKALMFLWAEAVATACYTQNRSLIHTSHNKTPYELVHDKKPDLIFLRVFDALCYPTNDNEDHEKLQPTADIRIFISSGLVPNPVLAAPYVPPTDKELEILFQPMFDEYLEPFRVERSVSPSPAVPVPVNSVGIAARSTIIEDNPFALVDNDPFVNVFAPEPSSEASLSEDCDLSGSGFSFLLAVASFFSGSGNSVTRKDAFNHLADLEYLQSVGFS